MSNPLAAMRRATSLAAQDPSQALSILEGALARCADSADTLALCRHAGAVASGSGEHRQALRFLAKALALAPDDPWLYVARANELEMLGERAGALASAALAERFGADDSEILAMVERIRSRLS